MATQVQTQYIADDAVTTAKIVDGAITAGKLDAGVVDGILAEKIVGKWVLSSELSSPSQNNVNVKTLLGFDVTAGVDPEGTTKGKACLLEASGGAEYDTATNKVGASALIRSSKCQIIDANGDAIVDAGGDEVWGVITASSRTTGGTYRLRFFSGEFGSGSEIQYTMSQAFKFTYPQIFDLSDMPQWSDERATLVDKDAAQLAAGQITATELASNAVTTVKISDSNVTTAKIADANVTTGKLADSAVTTAKINDASVTAGKLASDAVTTVKILDANVTTAKINDAAVTEGKLANDAVATSKILDANVTTAKLASGAVTSAKIGAGEVAASNIASDAVTTVKILDANVTQAKLASAVVARVGGGWDAIAAFIGDGSTDTFSFVHTDVHDSEAKMLVTVGGLVMERIDDYSISDGTGAAGVDQIVFVTAPPSGAHAIVRYRRTSI